MRPAWKWMFTPEQRAITCVSLCASDRNVTSQPTAVWTTGRLRFSAGSCCGGRSWMLCLSATLQMAVYFPLWTWGISSRTRGRTLHSSMPKASYSPMNLTSGVRCLVTIYCKVPTFIWCVCLINSLDSTCPAPTKMQTKLETRFSTQKSLQQPKSQIFFFRSWYVCWMCT